MYYCTSRPSSIDNLCSSRSHQRIDKPDLTPSRTTSKYLLRLQYARGFQILWRGESKAQHDATPLYCLPPSDWRTQRGSRPERRPLSPHVPAWRAYHLQSMISTCRSCRQYHIHHYPSLLSLAALVLRRPTKNPPESQWPTCVRDHRSMFIEHDYGAQRNPGQPQMHHRNTMQHPQRESMTIQYGSLCTRCE